MTTPPKTPPSSWILWILIWAVLLMVYFAVSGPEDGRPEAINYSQFKSLVKQRQVERIVFEGEKLTGDLAGEVSGAGGVMTDRVTTRMPPGGDTDLMRRLTEQGVEVIVRAPSQGWGAVASSILPWALILGFWFLIWRRLFGGVAGGLGRTGLQDFLRGHARKVGPETAPKVTFADVAGQDNAKREVAELLEFLRHPERYRRLGAEVPHGILLEGPPGTGKTLLARALAGEAQVPFLHISASEFIEVFVGVGAARVRQLFEQAKTEAPSIIFIDELDSVGRVRGAGFGGGHDEREQTLNQILAEMDGFEGHEAVVVLAATNRPDVLDPALVRPGRFDRHITLELPDLSARKSILQLHCRNVPLADDVDLKKSRQGRPASPART